MRALFRSLACLLVLGVSVPALAQPYPSKAVHIIVPFPPSGAADLLTRALGKKLSEAWGQAVVADNRPGAGGNIGAEAAAKANFASQGNGTLSHLEYELMRSMGGFRANHIPYKGSAPAMIDLLAGTVTVFFDSIPSSLPQVRSGKLRGIAMASSRRSPVLPDLPTVSEAGLTGFAADSWFGIMAPGGTPREIIAKLNADVVKALDSAEVKDIITRQGGEVMGSTPEQMAAQIRGDREKWGRVIRESGAKIE